MSGVLLTDVFNDKGMVNLVDTPIYTIQSILSNSKHEEE